MNGSKFGILGGGMVAGYAAKQLVELGLRPGELTILSADSSVPYERPPLSKGFLAGKDSEDAIRINAEDFYRKNGIELKLKCEISAVDAQRRRLILKSGRRVRIQQADRCHGCPPAQAKYSRRESPKLVLSPHLGGLQSHSKHIGKGKTCSCDRRRLHRHGSSRGACTEGCYSHYGSE